MTLEHIKKTQHAKKRLLDVIDGYNPEIQKRKLWKKQAD